LSNGAKLVDFQIELAILGWELEADERLESKLVNDAIGFLWFVEDQDWVHGRFHFKSSNYVAVWDQVRDGGYVDCAIHLGVDPVQNNKWNGNPLSIVSAAVNFSRQPIVDKPAEKQASRKGLFGRAHR
jgi:hypothetical protein